jgi:hypothetical protein
VYYTCLAGFWIACLNIFFLTVPPVAEGPKWQTAASIIGSNPGLGLRPQAPDARIDSSMISLRVGPVRETTSH